MHEFLFLLYRRNKVSKAAWPGNDLPIFCGNTSNQAKLNDLVQELKGTCMTKYFDEESIRQNIIDSMAERRHAIKKGYDYDKVRI